MERRENVTTQELEIPTEGFEKLPENVVTDVIVTSAFKNSNDPRIKYWTNPRTIIPSLFFGTVQDGPIQRIQTPTGFRTAIVEMPYLYNEEPIQDEYGTSYGMIDAKGVGVSSFCKDVFNLQISLEPVGLFGLIDALHDREISEAFARVYGRTARILAMVVLDHQKLHEWFTTLTYFEPLTSNLRKVEGNNDQAVIAIRLLGADRIQDYSFSNPDKNHFFHSAQMLKRAAGILHHEVKSRGETHFRQRYAIKQSTNLGNLERILAGDINDETIFVHSKLIEELSCWNISRKNYTTNRLGYDIKPDIREHNFDAAGFWYDWECSYPSYINVSYVRLNTNIPDYFYQQS